MARQKRKLTPEEKAAKAKRRKEYMMIFVNGKQKRVKRPPTIEGMDADEYILRNADPIWLHQNEMWEYMDQNEEQTNEQSNDPNDNPINDPNDNPINDLNDDPKNDRNEDQNESRDEDFHLPF